MANDVPPAWLIPWCASCGDTVDRFTIYPPDDRGIAVDAQCHGKTEGVRITPAQLLLKDRHARRVVVFQRHQGFDSTR